ncbi:hypothetical protein AKJ16_DCAP12880 [Drosera capensis]
MILSKKLRTQKVKLVLCGHRPLKMEMRIHVKDQVVSSHNVISSAVISAVKVFESCNGEIQDVKEVEMLPPPWICIFLFDAASPDEG